MKRLVLIASLCSVLGIFSASAQDNADMVFFKLGEQMKAKGDFQAAISNYDLGLAVADTSSLIYNSKGECLLALKQTDKAIEAWNKALSLRSNYPQVFQSLLKVYKETKNDLKYIETLDKYAQVLSPGDKATSYLEIANLYYNSGDKVKALEYSQKSYKEISAKTEAYYLAGLIYNEQKKFAEAATVLKKGVGFLNSSDPKSSAKFYYNWGLALYNGGKFEESVEILQKASYGPYKPKVARLMPDYYYNVASTMMTLHEWDEAETMLKKALTIDPSFAKANLMLADLALKRAGTASAVGYYDKALKGKTGNDKQTVEIYSEYIDLLILSHKYSEASKLAEQCLTKYPQALGVAYLKAVAYGKNNQKDAAISQLKQLLTKPGLAPIDKVTYTFTIGMFEKDANKEKATSTFNKAKKGPFSNAADYMLVQLGAVEL
ncbi:tetratricopeptide repeat protein [Sediminitomix flava]|nr:tetratricopeptide repeat protein [Sediminitomix flava]